MFYFYYFFTSYDQWSLEEKTMDLNHTLINREALNERIRQLQVLRQNPGIQFPGIREVKTDGWVTEELEEVLSKGTSCLSNEKLDWLSFSPVALFQLHDAINEEMPDAWYGLMVEDAKELWNNRPLVSRLKELAVNREALINHIRELQKKDNFKTNGWIGEELERVLEKGIQTLSPIRQNWLINNPVALFQIYEAVNEEMPDAWMPAIQADANRLAIGNKRLRQKGVELFERIRKGQISANPEPVKLPAVPTVTLYPGQITVGTPSPVTTPSVPVTGTESTGSVPSAPVTAGIIPTAFAAASMLTSKPMCSSHFIAQLTLDGGPNPADEFANIIRQCNNPDSEHTAWFKSSLSQARFDLSGRSICILFYRLPSGGIEALIARIKPNLGKPPDDVTRFYEGYRNLKYYWRLGGKRERFQSPDIVITRFDSLDRIPGISSAGGLRAVETFAGHPTRAIWEFPEGCFPGGITNPLEWLRSLIKT